MPPKRSLEAKLSRLGELREAPETPELHNELAKHLTDKSAHVVARAASVIEARRIEALGEDVEAQFVRFMVDPNKLDKGCIAKTAIAACLASLELGSAELFLKGLRHIQLEPSFGGPVDTAVELRSQSAFGLPSTGYPDTVLELTTALADEAYPVRQAAVRALSSLGGIEVEPLLRLKALHGDPEPQVLSETLEALLVLSPERSLVFVEPYLDASDDAIAEAAMLALGASRCEGAFELLTSRVDRSFSRSSLTRTLLLAIAMLRRDAAIAFLLNLVIEGPRRRAEDALRALAIHRFDGALLERVASAVEARKEDSLRELYAKEFPSGSSSSEPL